MPKVTIALITYNRPEFLKPAIEAVLRQTFTDYEFLILDNGSTPETFELVKTFTDSRIRYVKNPVNDREFYNYCFFVAAGEFLLLTHDDDMMLSGMIQEQLNVFERVPDVVGVSTNMRGIDHSGKVLVERMHPYPNDVIIGKDQYLKFFLTGNSLFAPTVMLNLDYCRKKGLIFEQKVGPACDQYMWYSILKNDVKIVLMADVLYEYRMHPSQMSNLVGHSMNLELLLLWMKETVNQLSIYTEERKMMLRKIFDLVRFNPVLREDKTGLLRRIDYFLEPESRFSKDRIHFYLIIQYPDLYEFGQKLIRKLQLMTGTYKAS